MDHPLIEKIYGFNEFFISIKMQKKTTQNATNQPVQNKPIAASTGSADEAFLAYPLNYTYLVVCLSSIFGGTSDVEIASFWNKYRRTLKEMFADFPDYDISPVAVRSLLMLTGKSWARSLFEEVIGPISDRFEYGWIADENSKDEESDLVTLHGYAETYSEISFFELFFLVTKDGIALGQKRGFSGKDDKISFPKQPKVLDLSSCVMTGEGAEDPVKTIEWIFDLNADYFLEITRKNEELLNAIQTAFNKAANDDSRTCVVKDDLNPKAPALSINVLPSKLLQIEEYKKWKGITDGSLVKATFRKKDKAIGKEECQDHFYISSFAFANPQVAEQSARAIWNRPKTSDSFYYLFNVDFFQDISQIKNVNYVANAKALKNSYDWIKDDLEKETLRGFVKLKKSSKLANPKEILTDLITDVAVSYADEHEKQKMEEDREMNPWDY